MSSNAMIDRLEAQRREQEDFIETTCAKAEEEGRDLVDAEKRNLEGARDRIKQIDEQLTPLKDFADLRAAHREGGTVRPTGAGSDDGKARGLGAQTQSRGHEYRTAGEVMADAWRVKTRQDEGGEASKRLESIGRAIEGGKLTVVDMGRARDVDAALVAALPAEKRASAPNVTTVEIPGVLPVTIQGDLVNDIDAARPFLNSIGVKDMSGIPGKTFTRPVVSEHVQMGTQSAEKSAVQAGQFKIDDVDFAKSTEGGYVDVSRQSIDWSSPAMWNALLADFLAIYARHTENKAADAFVTAVQTGDAVNADITDPAAPSLDNYIDSMYAGAVQMYGDVQRLPDHAWISLDVWARMGALLDKASAAAAGQGVGSADVSSLNSGSMLTLPRTVVPSFPAATFIVGAKNRVEAYEERLGFLSAVEPKLLGVELAYGGYFASNVLDVDAFVELTYT